MCTFAFGNIYNSLRNISILLIKKHTVVTPSIRFRFEWSAMLAPSALFQRFALIFLSSVVTSFLLFPGGISVNISGLSVCPFPPTSEQVIDSFCSFFIVKLARRVSIKKEVTVGTIGEVLNYVTQLNHEVAWYVVYKPLSAASISEDIAQGWKIVRKRTIDRGAKIRGQLWNNFSKRTLIRRVIKYHSTLL